MKKIALITTGGTIASKKNEQGRLVSGALDSEDYCDLDEISAETEVSIFPLINKPSMHVSLNDLNQIAEKIQMLFNQGFDGAVVTHGTDSLEESAYYLDLTVDHQNPVIVTGSQRSSSASGSDTDTNLVQSIAAASSDKLKGIGTMVVFNERIFSAKYVKKEHSYNLQGFESFGYGHLGTIDGQRVILYQKPAERQVYPSADSHMPKVEIIKCYLDADRTLIDACIDNQADGIILEGNGRGQIAPAQMEAVLRGLKEGVTFVLTTSSEQGRVDISYDYYASAHHLFENGVIMGSDLNSKKARLKLIALLRSETSVQEGFRE
ncbi:asparaginase [Salisediminibacterium halotolerans]|uniref:asparaginase n=1 Tax=Salisediminibacterium halotolerans TaxID=517425 RepID=UPI000EADE400|nr:asparaginase [Salisediminibacterium halotolerans]RLJ72229.1 L-asparaginase [Actinophytocola xinjiangensis]RPE85442.1 L-asparaginase [Salisediminibacterium halotolerans]TWG33399.1 L-asparaginase [Salisediminibacterium halotolerans]GEL07879.1 L-asparaginase [Salisediminibacterium halotolerans]